MFDEDTLIRRAAVEALLNCLYSEEIFLRVRVCAAASLVKCSTCCRVLVDPSHRPLPSFRVLQFASKEGGSFERLKLWILYSGVLYEEEGEFDLRASLLSGATSSCGKRVSPAIRPSSFLPGGRPSSTAKPSCRSPCPSYLTDAASSRLSTFSL